MTIELTEDDVKFVVGCIDVLVRQQGLSAASKSLELAAKLQQAIQAEAMKGQSEK